MQTSYSQACPIGFLGMKADSRFDHVESKVALETIPVGYVVVKCLGLDKTAMLPAKNKAVQTFDIDFLASNSVVTTINGVALTAVVYATSHAATIAAVAAMIATAANVKSSVANATARTITTIMNPGYTIVIDSVVSAGSSQPVDTTVYSMAQDLSKDGGIALHTHTLEQDDDTGAVFYKVNEMVNFLRQGAAFCYAEGAMSSDGDVYVRFMDAGPGKIIGAVRADSDSGDAVLWTGARVTTTVAAAGIVEIKINLP
jgi:hypothetical protein